MNTLNVCIRKFQGQQIGLPIKGSRDKAYQVKQTIHRKWTHYDYGYSCWCGYGRWCLVMLVVSEVNMVPRQWQTYSQRMYI